MSKYTNAELKEAVTALNAVLETGKIKLVARKMTDIESDFRSTMLDFIEAETAGGLPGTVIDFYNEYIAEESDEESGEEEDVVEEDVEEEEVKPAKTTKPAAKKTTGKATKPAAKKTTGKATKPAAKTTKPAAKVTKPAAKKTTGKASEGKKDGKTKVRKRDSEGVVAKAVYAYQTLGIRDTKELKDHLQELFPDRPIASTVSHVTCILGWVEGI